MDGTEEILFENRAMPNMQLRAAIMPESIDKEARTFRVQYASEAPVYRQRYFEEDFYEILSTEKGHVRLGRMTAGRAPFLNTHKNFDLSHVLGAVIDADETHCTIKFSARAELAGMWQDICDGVIANVSVGYWVHRYADETPDGDKVRVLRAIDWEPFEVSGVPVGADPNAGVRTAETVRCIVTGSKTNADKGLKTMDENEKQKLLDEANKRAADPATPAAAPVAPAAPAAPQADTRTPAQIAQAAVAEERVRANEIEDMVRSVGLDDSFARELVREGKTAEQARAAIITKLATGDEQTNIRSNVRITRDERETRAASVETYLMHRANPSDIKLEGQAQEFRGMKMLDICREIVGHRECKGLSGMEIAQRAMHSTSDFPLIMANVANKSLRKGYTDTKRSFLPFTREVSLPDFKTVSRVALSNGPNLKQVYEGGEYEYGTFTEGAESYRLFTYGRIFAITREAIINDDMDAFVRIPQKMGSASVRLENRMVWDIILGNPVMSDGIALFHASHGNLVNNLLNIAGLGAMRKAARIQKDPSGEDTLNTEMKYLLVPAALELQALQLQGQYMPAQASNVNPYNNSFTIITEAYLDSVDAVSFYMAASPNDVDTIEYAYLDGQSGPYMETREGFHRDGIEMKARHDFAAKAIDFRGFVKSTGNGS